MPSTIDSSEVKVLHAHPWRLGDSRAPAIAAPNAVPSALGLPVLMAGHAA